MESRTMTIKFEGNLDPALAQLAKLAAIPKQITDDAYTYFRDITPIRSGNARRNTRKQGDTIVAAYPYAQRLDEGYSKQFQGRGMTKPTQEYIDKRIQELVRKTP